MRVVLYLVLLALAGGVALGGFRHREARALRRQNANLRQSVSDVHRLREENDRLAKLSIGPEELQRLRAEQSEIMRLRAEVGELRRTAGTTVPELQTRIQSTLAEAETASKNAVLIQARREAKERSKQTVNTLYHLVSVVRELGSLTGGQLPNSFEQLESMLTQLPEGHHLRIHTPAMLNSTDRFGISPGSFEFVPQQRPSTTKDGSVLLLRERTPRPSPDGGWVRAYGFADGVEEAFSRDGNFNEWEREQALSRQRSVSQKN